MGVSPLNY